MYSCDIGLHCQQVRKGKDEELVGSKMQTKFLLLMARIMEAYAVLRIFPRGCLLMHSGRVDYVGKGL